MRKSDREVVSFARRLRIAIAVSPAAGTAGREMEWIERDGVPQRSAWSRRRLVRAQFFDTSLIQTTSLFRAFDMRILFGQTLPS